MAPVEFLLAERAKAARIGDRGVYNAITADLERVGYVEPVQQAEPPERVETEAGMETAAVRAPQRAVPAKKPGGRPALPRCRHGKIDDGRCARCKAAKR